MLNSSTVFRRLFVGFCVLNNGMKTCKFFHITKFYYYSPVLVSVSVLSQVHWETRYRIGQFDIENKNCMHSHTMKWHIRYLRSVSQCLFYWSFIFFSDGFPFKFWDFSQWTQNPTISRIRRYTFVFSKIKYNWTSNCTSKRFAKMNEATHKNFSIKNCFSVAPTNLSFDCAAWDLL